jgi:putative nucleotidyltransferase with HDIG domain
MIKGNVRSSNARTMAVGAAVFFLLYLSSLYSYLLFHSLAEIFSIIIAFAVFLFAWNTRKYMENNYLQFIGIAMLFVGGVDLMHTLAYKDMGVFTNNDANLPTQLWIAARYLQSISFLIAPFFIARKNNLAYVMLFYSAILVLLFASIFIWGIFPDCYIEGVGLTNFKILSEYFISAILLGSILHLARYRAAFDWHVFQLIALSIAFTVSAELAFTTYLSVFGFSNFLGHIFKIAAFYALYRAILFTGLTKPFSTLFRELKAREEDLQEANLDLEEKVSQRTADLVLAKYQLEVAYADAILGWVEALDLRDHETSGHSLRVAELFKLLASAYGLPKESLPHHYRGALLHDIGKMGISDKILRKPSPLTDAEWEIMRQHPTTAYEMLSKIDYLTPALDIPYCHHEKWDGSGYPRGLKGEEIPIAARLFAVVDVWDALNSERPYRKAWPFEEARQHLIEESGKYFDPGIVEVFLGLLEQQPVAITSL